LKGAWIKIAEVLPKRSVKSCHDICKRLFNPANYKGKWNENEETVLLDLIKKYGR
jgi:hypothetical protein